MKSKEHFDKVADQWNNKVWAKDKQFASDIVQFADLMGYESSLYVGIGTGEIAKRFNCGSMIGIDISRKMLEQNKVMSKDRLIIGSALEIPFLDNTFDFVFARNLLKHVEDPNVVLGEMKRVTNSGGYVMTVESCVSKISDKKYPNFCVRTMEPDHNSFKTHSEIINMYVNNNFFAIDDLLYTQNAKWLKKWIESSKATKSVSDDILNVYRNASKSFLKRQNVVFTDDDDIKSDILWSFIRAKK